jgi:hypothetical protein
MRRATIPVLLAACALFAAPARAGTRHGPITFSGSCALAGTVSFDPPLSSAPQEGSAFATALGSCTGTLAGRRGRTRTLDGARARYVAWNRGLTSCGQGSATGGGYLVLRGRKLRFRLTETRITGAAALHLDGARGGSAEGTATIAQEEDPAEIAQRCATTGLRSARVDIRLQTSPAISG